MKRRIVLGGLIGSTLQLQLPSGFAQTGSALYPNKTVRILIAAAAGGGQDTLARAIADKLSARWKQPVIVESRPGAGGKIATHELLKASPDGYTLLVSNTGVLHLLHLDPNPGYELKDVLPLVRLTDTPVLLAVPPASKGRTVQEYGAELRRAKQPLTWASPGIGSTAHVLGTALASALQLEPVHIAYKGETPIIPDLMAGRLPAAIISGGPLKPFADRGDVKVLAVTGVKRSGLFPNVPSFSELGYEELSRVGFNGLFTVGGTPPDIARKIVQEVTDIMRLPDIVARLPVQGSDPVSDNHDFAQYAARENELWGRLIRKYKIKPQ